MADGPAGFTQDFSCPALLRIPLCFNSVSAKGLSPALALFSSSFAYRIFLQSRGPTTPSRPEPWRFGLFPVRSPLLGESLLFSLPPGTKMFQFPGFALCSAEWQNFILPGCPIRKSPGHGPFAPYRSLSQLITSFIACKSLGIHRTPFSYFIALGHSLTIVKK